MIFTKDIKKLSKELKYEFDNNDPFPHIVIKNLFDSTILENAISEINKVQGSVKSFNEKHQIKKLIEGASLLSDSTENIKKVFQGLNSVEFVTFLRELTSIDDLFEDNTFRGGGIHHIPPGGKLGVHIDFSRPRWDNAVYRRANALLYLNQHWEDSWNGHLELWDNSIKNGGKCIKKIRPDFNTLVIFGTKKQSWHGHPEILKCPTTRARQSFASYYYSNVAGNDLEPHSTIFE